MVKRAPLNIGLFSFLFLALILPTSITFGKSSEKYSGAADRSVEQSSTIPISIDASGFDPQDIQVEENDNVTWTNHTSNPVTLVEGLVNKLYIPLVTKNTGAGSSQLTPPPVLPSPGARITILPGDSYTRTFTTVGAYHFFLAEDMNATCTVTVTAMTRLPDLEAQNVTLDPNPVKADATTTLTARINNLGEGDAGAFSVSWAVFQQGQSDPVADGSWPVTGLAASAYQDLTTTLTLPEIGPYIVQVIADPTAALTETNTANNTKQVDLNVSGIITFCGDITTDTTWSYSTYILTCKVNVASGATLTINHGAIVKSGPGDYWSGTASGLDISGQLVANGTSDQPILFTSISDDTYGGDTNNDGTATAPAAGDWTQIAVRSGGTASFEHALIRYAGGSIYGSTQQSIFSDGGSLIFKNATLEYGAGVGVRSIANGLIDIQDSAIRNCGSHGVYFAASGAIVPVIKNTTFQSNTGYAIYLEPSAAITLDGTQLANNTAANNTTNGMRLSGDFTGASTLSGNLGFPYVLEQRGGNHSVTVQAGGTLTIQPGAVLKGWPGDSNSGNPTGLDILGQLVANGTADQPILFTSIYDDTYGGDTNNDSTAMAPAAGNWTEIAVRSGGTASFEHALIRYAGGSIYGAPQQSIYNLGGTLSFKNGTLEYSAGVGVRSIANGLIDIQNSTIRNCGSHGVYYSASGASAPVITNTAFQSNSGYAIYLEPSADITLDGTQLANNIAANNTTNGMRLSGDFTASSTLSGNLGFPYVLEQRGDNHSVLIRAGGVLNIQPGAVLKGWPGGYWNDYPTGLDVFGQLIAAGTAESPVVFTSISDDTYGGDTNNDGTATAPAPGNWTEIAVRSGGTASFEHALIRYAGGSIYGAPQQSIYNLGGTLSFKNDTLEYSAGVGVRSIANGLIDIQNSAIRNNNSHGVYYAASGASAPVITNTAFQSNSGYAIYLEPSADITLDGTQLANNTAANNTTNGMRLSGDFTASSTLSGNLGFPYVLEQRGDNHSVLIRAGGVLNIQPGAVLKGWPGGYWNDYPTGLDVLGQLIASGTADQPIVFTSISDDTYGGDTNNDGTATAPAPGNWTEIVVRSGGTASFEHAMVRYAGGALYGAPQHSIYNNGGALTLSHTTISNSGDVGIRAVGGTLVAQDSAFTNNQTGILVASLTSPQSISVSGCIFEGNTSWAISNPSGMTFSAINNWWGNLSGPTHPTNPSGTGDRVSDYVTFSPFLTVRPW